MRFIQHRSFFVSTDSCRSVAEFSAPHPPPTASPLPPESGISPFPVPGLGYGPARDVTSRVTASRWPRRGDVTSGRDHRPPALPPGPLPNRYPLFGVRRCARAPTGVCQGLRALTQRSPRSGRFTVMRLQTCEAHWWRGLAQPPIMDSAEVWRSCALESFEWWRRAT